ncbi:propionyl-CoA synthetase [Nitriliruptor alkaliphilus]|uniref:propionyl-CoA synthetase n=1 Tax=Nitriliruptor alkaliphilus TaxID=427918 RepID=UPI000697A2F7|nr:propionyl-CoA synthetase [Nitriliruptor alkaliphilus]
MPTTEELHRRSIDDPEGFWREASAGIDWFHPPERILDASRQPFVRWFPDGQMNTCFNAVDRHVADGRGDQAAIIHDSPVTGVVTTLSYTELLEQVARFAGALRQLGVGRGDRVLIYMPMIPEAAVAMLACARLGAIHSVVFGGFAARELAVRIDDARPTVVVAASCGIEGARVLPYQPLLLQALELADHQPDACVIRQRPESPATLRAGLDHDWEAVVSEALWVDCVPLAATDPLYILYTSGTTGLPKGIVRDNGGHAVALRWSMEHVYGVHPGEVFWAASDVGWVVGHSYAVYGPLLTGCTTVLYEGKPVGTPDAGAFGRVIADHDVKVLFTAPTAFRAIAQADPDGTLMRQHDLGGLRALFFAGERLDADTYHWAGALLDRPVVDHWWQTETGWPIVANCLGIEPLPMKPGSPTTPVPGWDVAVLDEAGEEVPAGTEGAVVVRSPLPPGSATTLWGDDGRFVEAYFSRYPGCYLTGDGGSIDEDGYVTILGRIDDVINVAGHRLSTGTMEAVIAEHPLVAECAVIGAADELKGQVPLGLVVVRTEAEVDVDQLRSELVAKVREEVGPVAALKEIVVVQRLPRTRSGKILRSTMRALVDGSPYRAPTTIEDPAVLQELSQTLAARRPGEGASDTSGAPGPR